MKEQTINLLILCGGLLVFSILLTFVGMRIGAGKEVLSYLGGVGSGFSGALFAILRMSPGGNGPTGG